MLKYYTGPLDCGVIGNVVDATILFDCVGSFPVDINERNCFLDGTIPFECESYRVLTTN